MKKKLIIESFPPGRVYKLLLTMKITTFLLLVFLTNVSAKVIAQNQKITLKVENVKIQDILEKISLMTNVDFFYSNEKIDVKKKMSINVKNKKLKNVLADIFNLDKIKIEYVSNSVIIKKDVPKLAIQDNRVEIQGRVVDEKGRSMPGVTVVIQGTVIGVSTDAKGKFKIRVKKNDALRFSFIGYKTKLVLIKDFEEKLVVKMYSKTESLEEVSVVAFGTQKKESVVSSITTIRPMDLKSSNSDLTSSFAGKIAGMIGWQTGGLPGALTEEEMNAKFYIRGITSFQAGANTDPLILLDGVESSKLDLARMSPEDIDTFSVMKDASATAMYGARGANGVILVTTKKGEEGSVYASARYEMIFSMPTKEIDVVDPINYMKMYNQALMARDPMATPKYSVERINRTASGKYPSWVYPANDWYKKMFKNYNLNHHFGVSIRGGSKVVQYYASVNHNRDMGMLKTDKLNDFDCNISNKQTSFRINLNIDLKAGIKLVVNSSTNIDKYHGPLESMSQAYWLAFNASPVDFAPIYPGDATFNWPHLRFGTTESDQVNPYALLHRGYMERNRYSTMNRAEYIQNLSGLVKGLEARVSVAVLQSGYYTTGFRTMPSKYSLLNYDFETGEHTLQDLSVTSNRALSIDRDASVSTTNTRVAYEARLLHTAAWKDHQTSLTAVFQAQEYTYTPIKKVLDGMPQRNLIYSMRGSYGYKDRYFIEGSFGYNGSERFAKSNRMGFFPAGGAAWIVTHEPFMLSVSNWMTFLKLRASYGKVGNDGVISSPRFVYMPTLGSQMGYTDPEAGNGSGMTVKKVYGYPNKDIKWEVAEQMNFGIDAKLFKGLLEFNLDVYQEIRHNIIGFRSNVPANMGIEFQQLDNIGKTQSRGVDFSGKIQHAFNKDFWIIFNGTITYNKVVYKEIEEADDKPVWQRKVGKEISQQLGYIAEGLFQDQAEIDNSPMQSGDIKPGDIRYRDLNNDGVIDVNDATFIGFPQTPRLIYGINGFINYKNIELNFAFQGSGNRSFFMNPRDLSPFADDHAMLTAIADDHWSEDNMSKKPFWPRLSTYNLVQHNPEEDWYNANNADVRKSTYFMRECRFLRCTSLGLTYNMPQKLMKRWKIQNMKFFVRANNPFVISNFKLWDVELGENGFNYPIQKTYTVGLNFSF